MVCARGKEGNREVECEKGPGLDGIIAEMLKYGEDAIVEWMLLIYSDLVLNHNLLFG